MGIYSILLINLQTLLEFYQFSTTVLFLAWDPMQDPLLYSIVMSRRIPNLCQSYLPWPCHFWRVMVSYFVECLNDVSWCLDSGYAGKYSVEYISLGCICSKSGNMSYININDLKGCVLNSLGLILFPQFRSTEDFPFTNKRVSQ